MPPCSGTSGALLSTGRLYAYTDPVRGILFSGVGPFPLRWCALCHIPMDQSCFNFNKRTSEVYLSLTASTCNCVLRITSFDDFSPASVARTCARVSMATRPHACICVLCLHILYHARVPERAYVLRTCFHKSWHDASFALRSYSL